MPMNFLLGRAASRLLPIVLLCGFSFGGARATDAPDPPSVETVRQVDAATRRIEIIDADSLLLEYPDWLTRVTSLDPNVIRVSAVRPNCLRIQRVARGTATLQAVDRGDQRYSLELVFQDSTGRR